MTAIFALISGAAVAQTHIGYTSPIANYQVFVDERVAAWIAANDKVGQIGGWRAYAKEAQQAVNTPQQIPNSTTPPRTIAPEPQVGQHK